MRAALELFTSQGYHASTTPQVARRAGVAKFSPHDGRRSYISALLDAGADLSVVSTLVGHSSPSTTARYDRRGERAGRAAVARLQIPYARRRRPEAEAAPE